MGIKDASIIRPWHSRLKPPVHDEDPTVDSFQYCRL